jgi:hypothetical protein
MLRIKALTGLESHNQPIGPPLMRAVGFVRRLMSHSYRIAFLHSATRSLNYRPWLVVVLLRLSADMQVIRTTCHPLALTVCRSPVLVFRP